MSGHTDGNWYLRGVARYEADGVRYQDVRAIQSDGVEIHVAAVVSEGALGECIRNGKLIAAAPDLLAALEEIKTRMSQARYGNADEMGQSLEANATWWAAHNAIEKAKGN